jgi:hypothetical protein
MASIFFMRPHDRLPAERQPGRSRAAFPCEVSPICTGYANSLSAQKLLTIKQLATMPEISNHQGLPKDLAGCRRVGHCVVRFSLQTPSFQLS